MAATLYMRMFANASDVTKYVSDNSIKPADIQWGPDRGYRNTQWILWFWWDPTDHNNQLPPGSVPPFPRGGSDV